MAKKNDEQIAWLAARLILGVIYVVITIHLFFVGSPSQGLHRNETLYQFTHPWHWFFDSVAFIGLIGVGLFLSGWAKPVYDFIYKKFQPDEEGGHWPYVFAVVLMFALTCLFFV